MKKIIYSPDYKAKIRKMRRELDRQFGSETRQEIFKKINDRIHSIQDHEDIGLSCREVFCVDTDYQCIYTAKNYIFYRIDEDAIRIVKIYDEREDIMWKMFGIKTTTKETEDYWKE